MHGFPQVINKLYVTISTSGSIRIYILDQSIFVTSVRIMMSFVISGPVDGLQFLFFQWEREKSLFQHRGKMLRNYEKSYDRLSHGNELFPSPLLMLLNALLQSVVKKIEHRNGLQTSTSIKKNPICGDHSNTLSVITWASATQVTTSDNQLSKFISYRHLKPGNKKRKYYPLALLLLA